MKLHTILATATVAAFIASPAWAGQTINGTVLNGPHYNLNIIGMENPKKSKMTGSNRHVIFVALRSTKTGKNSKTQIDDDGTLTSTALVDSKIWLTPGPDFRVCDGNGFDLAYDGCMSNFDTEWKRTTYLDDGTPVEQVSQKMGAVFMLPCNTNIGTDDDMDIIETGCDEPDENIASYSVWARGLGKPGGKATVTTCASVGGGEFPDVYCSLENAIIESDDRPSKFTDVTDELTSLRINICDGDLIDNMDGTFSCNGTFTRERIALFAGDTEDWFWNYDNNGLRLAQLRFYYTAP